MKLFFGTDGVLFRLNSQFGHYTMHFGPISSPYNFFLRFSKYTKQNVSI